MTAPAATAVRLRGRDLLSSVAEGTAGAVGGEFLRGLVRHVADAFAARVALVAEADGARGERVRVLACWMDGRFAEPFAYETEGQPCALLPEHAVVAVPEALTTRFPADVAAAQMGLESYLAVCLRAADGRHVGHLALLDGRPMEAAEEDLAALRIFASRAAAEVERRQQEVALAASRARVIEAADAERRRVGRDLHDGAQQRLLAVSTLLRVARKRLDVARGPDDRVETLLADAAAELDQAHAELRELARGLHPVALAERGLAEALSSLTASCPVPVQLRVCDERVPDKLATAAYYVVAECVANAVRHADPRGLAVRVEVCDDRLEVEVSDDGRGGADLQAGTGLRGLEDRVAVLGGRLLVESAAGSGTRVRATVPLPAEPAAAS